MYYIKWGFESRLKRTTKPVPLVKNYIKWGFESRLKHISATASFKSNYIKWGFESRLKPNTLPIALFIIISNGDLRVD